MAMRRVVVTKQLKEHATTRSLSLLAFCYSQKLVDSATPYCVPWFMPPATPKAATDHNGAALPDVCIHKTGSEAHVFVIGDWGGIWDGNKGHPVPADKRGTGFPEAARDFVVGVDDCAQVRVAEQMQLRAAVKDPDYVLNVGDNFYWAGLAGHCGTPMNTHLQTGQWHLVYESVYQGAGLDYKQWLGILGNHDYGGFMFTAAWDQSIAYTYTGGSWSTRRWITPAQYWRVKVWYDGFSVDYFFVDTNVFAAFDPSAFPEHNVCSGLHNTKDASCGHDLRPTSLNDCPEMFRTLWTDELEWLEGHLDASVADWQIVVTHFPPEWGADIWNRLAWDYGIDLVLSGHRHEQGVFVRNGPEVNYVVSGGGGGITSERVPDKDGRDDQYGFVDLTISKSSLKIEMISHGGHVRNTTTLSPRPRKANAGAPGPEVAQAASTGISLVSNASMSFSGRHKREDDVKAAKDLSIPVRADANTVGPRERFTLVRSTGNTVALMASNGRYVTVDADGDLWANATEVSVWERFIFVEHATGTISLRNFQGWFLAAYPDGQVLCDAAPDIYASQKFKLIRHKRRKGIKRATVSLLSADNKYLSAHPASQPIKQRLRENGQQSEQDVGTPVEDIGTLHV